MVRVRELRIEIQKEIFQPFPTILHLSVINFPNCGKKTNLFHNHSSLCITCHVSPLSRYRDVMYISRRHVCEMLLRCLFEDAQFLSFDSVSKNVVVSRRVSLDQPCRKQRNVNFYSMLKGCS